MRYQILIRRQKKCVSITSFNFGFKLVNTKRTKTLSFWNYQFCVAILSLCVLATFTVLDGVWFLFILFACIIISQGRFYYFSKGHQGYWALFEHCWGNQNQYSPISNNISQVISNKYKKVLLIFLGLDSSISKWVLFIFWCSESSLLKYRKFCFLKSSIFRNKLFKLKAGTFFFPIYRKFSELLFQLKI